MKSTKMMLLMPRKGKKNPVHLDMGQSLDGEPRPRDVAAMTTRRRWSRYQVQPDVEAGEEGHDEGHVEECHVEGGHDEAQLSHAEARRELQHQAQGVPGVPAELLGGGLQ